MLSAKKSRRISLSALFNSSKLSPERSLPDYWRVEGRLISIQCGAGSYTIVSKR